jgi:hypothetical protein
MSVIEVKFIDDNRFTFFAIVHSKLPQNTELPYGLEIIPQKFRKNFRQHYLIFPRVPMPLFDYLKLLRIITKDLKPIKL